MLTPQNANFLVNNPGMLLPDKPIAFNRDLVRIGCGVGGALMLSQALYWSKRTKDNQGWFYKTQEEWEEETGLTKEEQKTLNKRLTALGYLTVEKRGLPAKNHYKVNETALVGAIATHKWGQMPPTGEGKCHPLSITENTTENTNNAVSTETPPLKEETASKIPLTFESYMYSLGYTEDSIVDDVGTTHTWWNDPNGTKVSKAGVSRLLGAYRASQRVSSSRVEPEISLVDKFVEIYAKGVEKRFGNKPLVNGKDKMILRKNLLDKYDKSFISEYATWFLDNKEIEKKWKYNVTALASTKFINQYLAQ